MAIARLNSNPAAAGNIAIAASFCPALLSKERTEKTTTHANSDTLPFRGTSAGGGYSTVGDLLRFANALSSHTLLNAECTEMLTTGKVDAPQGRYGYGFGDQQINGIRCFGHGGGAPGMNGDLQICPGPGYTIAVLANMDPPAADRIMDFVTNRLPEPSNKVR
jgi:D-alanyl-D-alanine carboxypeptidase